MKLENYETNTAKVVAWMSNGTIDDAGKLALETTMALGNNATNDEARSTFWTALRSIGSQYEGFPKARVGQPSLLSTEGQVSVANAVSQVRTAFASMPTEYHEILLAIGIVPHGRTGGVYANWDEACDAMAESSENYIMTAVKEDRWPNQKVNKAGVPQITPRLTKAERDALAGDDEGGNAE
jgi:hypothetical protein